MMKLSEDQRQSLITSLLGFVRRVSFHGADTPEEASGFSEIMTNLIMSGVLENDEMRKSENSGYVQDCKGCCERALECEERCPSSMF